MNKRYLWEVSVYRMYFTSELMNSIVCKLLLLLLTLMICVWSIYASDDLIINMKIRAVYHTDMGCVARLNREHVTVHITTVCMEFDSIWLVHNEHTQHPTNSHQLCIQMRWSHTHTNTNTESLLNGHMSNCWFHTNTNTDIASYQVSW